MSFPPNLGITNSFFIDSNYSLLFQQLPSLLPQLEQICSPFSIHRMNGYSRIKKSCRSKSLDFSDLSLAHHTPKPCSTVKIVKVHDLIPEQQQEEGKGEVFGIILGRKCSGPDNQNVLLEVQDSAAVQNVVAKRSFSIIRSASVSEGYSRIHHEFDVTAEDGKDGFRCRNAHGKKRKGKFFALLGACLDSCDSAYIVRFLVLTEINGGLDST